MVTANMSATDEIPEPTQEGQQTEINEEQTQRYEQTLSLVTSIEKRLTDAVTADELKKLTLD